TAYHLLEHLRFRAGYDFLLLRCEAGELPAEVGDWWTRFIEADSAGRDELLRSLAPQAGGSARRRRRRGGRGRSSGEASEAGDGPSSEDSSSGEEPAGRVRRPAPVETGLGGGHG